MKPDLNKLLCERERRGGLHSFKHTRRMKKYKPNLDPEEGDTGHREGMKRRYGWDTKTFNENLRPLLGQVRRWAHRPYDAFYSELCKVFDKRSVINQHIIQHLDDFLARDVYLKYGVLWSRGRYGFDDYPLADRNVEFYVDPRTKLILPNKAYARARFKQRSLILEAVREQLKTERTIDRDRIMRKIGRTWFIFDLRPIAAAGSYDAFQKKYVERSKYGKNLYHTNRRTASKKFLKEYVK